MLSWKCAQKIRGITRNASGGDGRPSREASASLAVLVHVDNLHTLVSAALRANRVRAVQAVALRAFHEVDGRQRVVGAPPIAARLRMLSFWKRWHSGFKLLIINAQRADVSFATLQ